MIKIKNIFLKRKQYYEALKLQDLYKSNNRVIWTLVMVSLFPARWHHGHVLGMPHSEREFRGYVSVNYYLQIKWVENFNVM